ncbi:MAG: hypothetical protein ACRDH2_04550 [Anaerolineales bacterium]
MPYTVQIHITNEEPMVGEIEKLPAANDTVLHVQNPRTRDNKDVRNLLPNVTTVILPIARLHFIQVVPTGEEEKVVGFVRE